MILFSLLKVNTLQNWLTEFNLWLPPQEALSPDTDPALMAGRIFKVHILNDEHKYVTCPVVQELILYVRAVSHAVSCSEQRWPGPRLWRTGLRMEEYC